MDTKPIKQRIKQLEKGLKDKENPNKEVTKAVIKELEMLLCEF